MMHDQPTQQNQAMPTVPHTPVAAATVPSNPTVQQTVPARPIASPPMSPPQSPPAAPPLRREDAPKSNKRGWLGWLIGGSALLIASICGATALGLGVILNSGILPGVSIAGIDLGGLSEADAAQRLAARWDQIILRDGERTFAIDPATLGMTLDADATAARAYAQGRDDGSLFAVLLGETQLQPVITVDAGQFQAGLNSLTGQINIPAQDAGVQLNGGQVSATPPQSGRQMDVEATLRQINNRPQMLAEGELVLVMQTVQPAVTDASALVNAAAALLQHPLIIQVYDPVTGDIVDWTAAPREWAEWISAQPDANSPFGLSLRLDENALRQFLSQQSTVFDASRRIDADEAVTAVQTALQAGETQSHIRVYHNPRQHTVQSGETVTSIAWDYGIPYLYIQEANDGLSALSAGQTITIPAADTFLEFDPIPNKRIVVSISGQRMQAYENGQLLWDWGASTGILDSPTWPGIYQILSHEENAYASNWNLYMPWFMGVYRPIPGSNFTNGFHGFPTRGGGQILWENSIGQRVTYGCILLSNSNIQLLWDWAETGVVVEIQQ